MGVVCGNFCMAVGICVCDVGNFCISVVVGISV